MEDVWLKKSECLQYELEFRRKKDFLRNIDVTVKEAIMQDFEFCYSKTAIYIRILLENYITNTR